ncbi:hypothetical protein OIV83_002735 [Microbotryomycetes sp. JL201]|nr:hypothetical protein OIV83_002735 [Microbotryomycetes sp. JL201]
MNKTSAQNDKTRAHGTPRTPNQIRKGAEHHDEYIQSMSILSNSINALKEKHGAAMGEKRNQIAREAGRTMCALAEAACRSKLDGSRKAGDKVGIVIDKGTWCESGMREAVFLDKPGGVEIAEPVHGSLPSPPRQSTLRGPRPPATNDQPRVTGQQYSNSTTSSGRRTLFEPSVDSMRSAFASTRLADRTQQSSSPHDLTAEPPVKVTNDVCDCEVDLRTVTKTQGPLTRPSARHSPTSARKALLPE